MAKNGGMGDIADQTAEQTNIELKEEELIILLETTVNLEDLRPRVADEDTYNKLLEAVQEATQKNNDIALLKARMASLGKAGIALFNKIRPLI